MKYATWVYVSVPVWILSELFSVILVSLGIGVVFIGRSMAYTLPDSGQSKCYDTAQEITCPRPDKEYYGQDGSYIGHHPSYVDNGDGTISDMVTGLIWQKEYDGVTRNWYDAIRYCGRLDLGGHGGWRLPTRKELLSIVDSGRSYGPNPIFPTPQEGDWYWSSSGKANNSSKAWYIYLDFDGRSDYQNKLYTYAIHCVYGDELR